MVDVRTQVGCASKRSPVPFYPFIGKQQSLYSGHHQYDLFGLGEWCSAESYVLVLFENRDQYLGCLTSTFETEVSKVF